MKKILFTILISLTLIATVKADYMNEEDIEDYSILIGTHLFTLDANPETGWTGTITTKFAMLAAMTIEDENMNSLNIYYKYANGVWGDYLSGELINNLSFPINITHINGACIDPSCSGEKYQVKFVQNEYFDEKIVEVSYYGTVNEKQFPTIKKERIGYKFSHWTEKGKEEAYDFTKPITSDTELEPYWTPIEYEITYHSNFSEDKTNNDTCRYDANNLDTSCRIKAYNDILQAYDNVGFEFQGWSTSPTGNPTYREESDIEDLLKNSNKIELYAIWNTNTYTFKYNGSETRCNYGEICEISFTPEVRPGYDFDHWSVNESGNEIIVPQTVVNFTQQDNKVYELTANYIPHTYTITYILDGAPIVEENETTIDLEHNNITLTAPTKKGYSFANWELTENSTSELTVDNTLKLSTENPENIVVRANWTPNKITIKFKDTNGNIIGNKECSYETANTCLVEIVPEITEVDKEFDGWQYEGIIYKVRSSVNTTALYNEPNKEITMTPKLSSKNKNIIEYDLNGGYFDEGNENISHVNYYLDDEETVTIPSPTKKGYVFVGWKTEDGNLITNGILEVTQGDIKLSAEWTAISYIIKFYDGETQVGEELECTYDAPCDLGDHSAYFENRTFIGWGYNDHVLYYGDKIIVMNLYDAYNEDGTQKELNLKAVVLSPHKVSFNLDGGELTNKLPLYYVSTIDLSNFVPERAGYSFEGWQVASTGEPVSDTYTIEEDVTFTAKWARNYTITFKNEDDSIIETYQIKNGDNLENLLSENIDRNATWILNGEEINLNDYLGENPIESDLTFIKKVEIVEPTPDPVEESET